MDSKAFCDRHIGPAQSDQRQMLSVLGCDSLDALMEKALPAAIRQTEPLKLRDFSEAQSERGALRELKALAAQNQVWRSYIGLGYHDCLTPAVIARNILENPGWYTQYTPYQPEISQGRLEALLNFQTMVCELTALPVSNASLLDEASAAAEAVILAANYGTRQGNKGRNLCLVDSDCHPQTIAVVKTRAEALGLKIETGEASSFKPDEHCFAVLIQYPGSSGRLSDPRAAIKAAHSAGALAIVAADIMSLLLLTPPGELGADVACGSTQRFGVPLGFGGPHAAFFAVKDELKRLMPGRLIGVSRDSDGLPALRLALQTREQHIRREKATSNICTSQVLLAIMASMYAVYHGPAGLRTIASRINRMAALLAEHLLALGLKVRNSHFFDTLEVEVSAKALPAIQQRAAERRVNLRYQGADTVFVALDETTEESDVEDLVQVLCGQAPKLNSAKLKSSLAQSIPEVLQRKSACLAQPVFNRYHSETEFLRYLRRLESRDLSLANAMIPLGSCTMKLNATSEMLPVSWREFSALHPFAPDDQTRGYQKLFSQLERALCDITGFSAVSLQPNSGATGEYAGLLTVCAYLRANGGLERKVCLIPRSAHGTNPASAAMAGLSVVVVECDAAGNIDIPDLKAKLAAHEGKVAALMATYPSTHGVFEEGIKEICELVHQGGGQVYMDGANLNALVGLSKPASIGVDVCHINLHKTFAIPHGGGGPGMGPIAVAAHLAAYLPGHPLQADSPAKACGTVAAAPHGSAGVLPIPWMYIALMSGRDLTQATKVAILNANYIAARLEKHYPVLYRGANGCVAHECILDCREIKRTSGVEVEDIAKRLMDYGFHAPTVAFPVHDTLMVEPTESESLQELDRFCEAMILIREEIDQIESGRMDKANNPLKRAPHTALQLAADNWDRPYSRIQAAYPTSASRQYKFWPTVGRVDAAYGDKNLFCTCG